MLPYCRQVVDQTVDGISISGAAVLKQNLDPPLLVVAFTDGGCETGEQTLDLGRLPDRIYYGAELESWSRTFSGYTGPPPAISLNLLSKFVDGQLLPDCLLLLLQTSLPVVPVDEQLPDMCPSKRVPVDIAVSTQGFQLISVVVPGESLCLVEQVFRDLEPFHQLSFRVASAVFPDIDTPLMVLPQPVGKVISLREPHRSLNARLGRFPSSRH